MTRLYKIDSMAEIAEKSKTPKFEVVSLFAGGGGSSTGYRMAYGKVLLINEFIPEAVKTYRENHKDTIIIEKDVRKVTGAEILQKINKKSGDLDILDGSPPCSAFSTLGKGSKGWGQDKKYSDSSQKNVEDLFFEYIQILRDIKPKIFVAENVKGLASGNSKGYLNQILRELKDSGYHVEAKILNAKDLNVPQQRQRIIFVGIRNDLMKDHYKGKLHPKPFGYTINLLTAFDGLEMSKNDRAETDMSKYSVYKLLKETKEGCSHPVRFGLKKISRYKYSQCIVATASTGSACVKHWDNRALTIGEIKRIMSIPDDYILTGSYDQKAERLGRMVPPHMMKAVAENLYNLVLKNGNSQKLDV